MERTKILSSVMTLAWRFIKMNGYTRSEALRCAWANIKLRKAMSQGIVRFHFVKVDGSIREAFGTLSESLIPAVGEGRRKNDNVQVYFDTEKQAWRSYKKCNLINIA